MLDYLPSDTELRDAPLWWHKQGLMQTASGYGRKLTTSKQALYNGRWYRVYATCISNAASCWIEVKGKRLYLLG
jgi:hypothetical protein